MYCLKGPEFFGTAYEYYLNSNEILQKNKSNKELCLLYLALADFHYDNISKKTYDLNKAIEYANLALQLSMDLNDDNLNALSNLLFANIYSDYNSFDKSFEYLSRAKSFIDSNLNKNLLFEIKFAESKNYFELKEYNKSLPIGLCATQLCKELENLDKLQNSYNLLSKIYQKIGDINKSLEFYKLSVDIKLNIYSNIKIGELSELETKYKSAKKEKENQELRHENRFKNLIIIASISFLFVLFFVIILILRNIKQKKLLNKTLSETNKQIENYNIELEKNNKTISDQNEELSLLFNELQFSETKYRNIFENTTIGIYRTTPSGEILIVNPAMLSILKYDTFEELAKLNLEKEQPYKNYSRAKFREEIEIKNKIIGLEGEWLAKDGSSIYIRESVILIRDDMGLPLYYDGVVEDITEKRNAELALIQSEKNLKESNDTKDKFFSIIAHDLKNPISALILSSDILFSYYNKLDDESRLKKIKQLSDSSNFLFKLLENLLQWSRSQAGAIEFEPSEINISNLVNTNIELLKLNANDKLINIISNVSPEIKVCCDENMINTVIRNLISNAIKFTNNNGNIEISASYDNGRVIVAVKDTGVGMTDAQLNKLFNVGSNFSTPGTNKERGTGLGLILCKEFVERHTGKIWVESEVGKGSCFYFTI